MIVSLHCCATIATLLVTRHTGAVILCNKEKTIIIIKYTQCVIGLRRIIGVCIVPGVEELEHPCPRNYFGKEGYNNILCHAKAHGEQNGADLSTLE